MNIVVLYILKQKAHLIRSIVSYPSRDVKHSFVANILVKQCRFAGNYFLKYF